ncbi:MAG: VOC family protein [Xanthomonadales bacterium]|nr:VOC family protein [Xanthomonadales bacterium]
MSAPDLNVKPGSLDTTSRPLDHLVIGVRDLDAAAETYGKLGFQLSPRMSHSHGTSNNLIMLHGAFLELLGDFDQVPDERKEGFVCDMADSLDHGEGVLATAFRPRDAQVDRLVLLEQGVDVLPCAGFTRPVPLPGGNFGEARITVAMSRYPTQPDLRLFLSQQHHPEVVWIPEWQEHPNGALHTSRIIFQLPSPRDHEAYFSAFANCPPDRLSDERVDWERSRGSLSLMSQRALSDHYGAVLHDLPGVVDGRVAVVEIQVSSLDRLSDYPTEMVLFKRPDGRPQLMTAAHGLLLGFHT